MPKYKARNFQQQQKITQKKNWNFLILDSLLKHIKKYSELLNLELQNPFRKMPCPATP